MIRKTKAITLTLLTAIAVAACDEDIKHCVDENGVVQDEKNCAASPTDGGDLPDGGAINSSNPVPVHFYRWYYGSGGGGVYSPGTRISGGSYTPAPGKAYSPPSISRGGFGGTGESFGGAGE